MVGEAVLRESNGSDARTDKIEYALAADAKSRATAAMTKWVSRCDVPYDGMLQYTLADGTVWSSGVKGQYSGMFMSDVALSFQQVLLALVSTVIALSTFFCDIGCLCVACGVCHCMVEVLWRAHG